MEKAVTPEKNVLAQQGSSPHIHGNYSVFTNDVNTGSRQGTHHQGHTQVRGKLLSGSGEWLVRTRRRHRGHQAHDDRRCPHILLRNGSPNGSLSEIIWSEVARKSILQKIEDLEFLEKFKSNSTMDEQLPLELGRKVNKALAARYSAGD